MQPLFSFYWPQLAAIMKHWRRTSRMTGAASATAILVQVLTDGSTTVQFSFNRQVQSVGDISAFDVGGDDAAGLITVLPASVLEVNFGLTHGSGEPWTIDLSFAGLVFTAGGTLSNVAGTTL